MFVYQSRFMTRGEVWFDAEPDDAPVDWIYYRQRSSPLARGKWKRFHTRLIDLGKTPAELRAEMDAKTARRISAAEEEDRLWCERCDSKDTQLLDEVEEMWNQFAISQHTPVLEREWLDQISKAGALDVVAARDPFGNLLAYHLVLLTPKRARQLIAISPYKAVPSVAWRKAVSRANCLIHWHNFRVFREQGIHEFDFGGWYPGTTDIRLLGINRFKQSFGGRVVRQYEGKQAVTARGWLLLEAARILQRLRGPSCMSCTETKRPNPASLYDEPRVSPALR